MTSDRRWTPPDLKPIPPDPASWPFTGNDDYRHRQPRHAWWLMYCLNTVTGELRALVNDPDAPRLTRPGGGYAPARDLWVHGYHWDRSPRLIGFPWAFACSLSAERVSRDLGLIAVRAERLLKSLQPVQGTHDWDWSVQAALAHHSICNITNVGKTDEAFLRRLEADTAGEPDRYLLTLEQVTALYPELEPSWSPLATMSDHHLDTLAATLAGGMIPPSPPKGLFADDDTARLSEWYGRSEKRGSSGGVCSRALVGVRASLYRLRAERANAITGYTAIPAGSFFAEHPGLLAGRISPDLSNDDVRELDAAIVAEVAREHRLTLLGVADRIVAERTDLRARVRDELGRVGGRAEAAAQAARQLGLQRAHLVSQIAAWEDPVDQHDGSLNQAALAERAHMSRQGLGQLLARLEAVAAD